MLTLKRAAVITGCAIAVVVAGTVPAYANGYGNVTCSQDPSPDCQLGAGTRGGSGGRGGTGGDQPSHAHGDSGSGSSAGSSGGDGDTIVGGGATVAHCSYAPSDYQPPAGAITAAYRWRSPSSGKPVQLVALTRPVERAAPAAPPVAGPALGQQGSWYVWKCTTAGVTDGLFHPPVFIPNGQPGPGAAPLPSPAQLAQMARSQLRLPTPTIAANPPGEQLVNLPTWMWLSSGWGPVSATASVPGVSVTAVATPTSVSWSMGDGSTVNCTAAGTPFQPGTDPTAPSPDCGHTYHTSSASQATQAFSVTATVHWTVTWSGAGQGGTFPDMTTTGNAAFRVAESQALNGD
jgi:hypothetical protein